MTLETDVANAAQRTKAWRAQYLTDAARRLDENAELLRQQAAEYRRIAAELNPTASVSTP